MLPDAGVMGFGPGTFRVVFPDYQRLHDFGGRTVPEFWTTHFWPHAHQDYLQTLIEWGWLGALFWAVLVFGGVLRGARNLFQRRGDFTLRWLTLCSLLGLIGTLLHALLDFPLQIASIQLYFAVLLGFCWSGTVAENHGGSAMFAAE